MNRRDPFTPSLTTLLLGAVLFVALSLPLLSGDLGWHIRVGRYVLDRHAVPRLNFLCYPALWHPWLTHEWLSGVLFAWLDAAGGLRALFLARGLVFFSTLLLLFRLGRRIGAEPLALAGLLLLTAVTLALHVSLRPWLFSNLLLAIALLLSDRLLRRPRDVRALWCFIPLLGLWINLHGGYIVGVGLFGMTLLYWALRAEADSSRIRLARVGMAAGLSLLTLAVLLANPHHGEALALPFLYLLGDQSSGLALTGEIKEWNPLVLESFFGGVYLLWAGLTGVAVLVSRNARRRPELWPGLLFLGLTLQAQRHLPLAALFLFPVVCTGLLAPFHARLELATHPRLRFLAGLSKQEGQPRGPFLALLALAIVGYTWMSSGDAGFEARAMQARRYPLAVVGKLATMPPGRIFNHYDWAGLMAWRAPEWPLFITPVNDAYPRQLFEDWLTIANLRPGWNDKLADYQIDTVLMPTSSALITTLRIDPDWKLELEEEGATLLRKAAAPKDAPASAAARH